MDTLKKLKQQIRRVRPSRKKNRGLFLHDNVRPHTNLRTGCTVLPHAPYSPNSSPLPLVFYHFGPLKDAFRQHRFVDDVDLNKRALRASTLQQRVLRDRHTASHAKMEKSVLIMKETLWKNNRNLKNDVRTISIDLIIIAIVVYEKKIRGIIFLPPLVCESFDSANGTRY
jgi:hypothetical protein